MDMEEITKALQHLEAERTAAEQYARDAKIALAAAPNDPAVVDRARNAEISLANAESNLRLVRDAYAIARENQKSARAKELRREARDHLAKRNKAEKRAIERAPKIDALFVSLTNELEAFAAEVDEARAAQLDHWRDAGVSIRAHAYSLPDLKSWVMNALASQIAHTLRGFPTTHVVELNYVSNGHGPETVAEALEVYGAKFPRKDADEWLKETEASLEGAQ